MTIGRHIRRGILGLMGLCLFISPAFAVEEENTRYNLDLFNRIFTLIEKVYLYPVDLQKCQYDILKALSQSSLPYDPLQARDTEKDEFVCLDKFSRFVTPEEARAMSQYERGAYGGIGVHLTVIEKNGRAGSVIVPHIFKKSPAKDAGMQVGDILLRARESGSDVFVDITIANAVDILTGKSGSEVVVVVERNGEEIVLPPIVRTIIELPSVYALTLPGEIEYVQVRSFTERTGDELEAALAKREGNASPRVIIDLRDNPGGMLWSVLESLFYFNKNPSAIALTERFKNREELLTIDYLATKCGNSETKKLNPCFVSPETGLFKNPGRFAHYRVVILVNERSASASEVFAGTMKDWGSQYKNFIIMGEKTFGKGVVQAVIPLADSEYAPRISLTISEYLVGNSQTAVHGVGVPPDFSVKDSRSKLVDTVTADDVQLHAALRMWGVLDTPGMKDFLSRIHFDEWGDVIE